MRNPVGWFEIYVDDMKRAKQFYEQVFKITLTELSNPDPTVQLQMLAFNFEENQPGATGALVKTEGMKAGGNSILVYFGCDDCHIEESRVETAGGKLLKPKMNIGEHGFVSICEDCEGNIFGLHSMN